MKNYLIVGGSSGIGAGIVQHLNAEHNVYYTFNSSTAEIADDKIKRWNAADEFTTEWLPDSLDGVVYCPGTINLKPFGRYKDEDFLTDYQTQVLGAIKVVRACEKLLKAGTNSSVTFFSSIAASVGMPYHALVGTHKAAIEGLTKSLAAEFKEKCRVNALALSLTDTPLAAKLLSTEEKKKTNGERHGLGRVGEVDDVVEAVNYLLAASWMTGQVIKLEGGISLK